jgi:hypothetical protein
VKESEIQDRIRLALGAVLDLVLFRNNSGVAKIGDRMVRFGVGGKGGADLIGIYRGRFVAVEIKSATGRQSPEQKRFEQLVERKGGVYVVLRSVEDAQQWIGSL